MAKLLEYTRFAEQEGTSRPDPFDDPYVGAALFTSDYRLLGAYRKRTAGERHSEPEAILEALKAFAGGAQTVRAIEQAYQDKIWLRTGQREVFEDHFRRAGEQMLQLAAAKGFIMLSSLEPCGLYEANPSCANILCACGVGRVLYASDDTNPKGRGRPILLAEGVKVDANVLPAQAVALNSRFFATVEICNDTYTDYSHRRLFSGPPCVTFVEKDDLFTTLIGPDERLVVKPVRPFLVEYAGPEHDIVSPFITPSELKAFEIDPVERDSTFFYGGGSLGELAKLLYRHVRTVGALPGRIVTPDNPFREPANDESDLADILSSRLKIHQNAFRKHHEVWRANRHLMLAAFRSELRDYVSALLKIAHPQDASADDSPYGFIFAAPEDLETRLLESARRLQGAGGHLARLTLIGNASSGARMAQLLRDVGRRGRAQALFDKTSIEVRLLPTPGAGDAQRATDILRQQVDALSDLAPEVLPPGNLGVDHTATRLEREIRSGRRDAKFFDPEYIDTLSRSLDWLERKHAGKISGRLAQTSPHYAESGVLRRLEQIASWNMRAQDWTEACTRLNAFRNAAPALRTHHADRAADVLQKLARALAAQTAAAPAWLDDVIWRWLACWFEVSSRVGPAAPPPELAARIRTSPFLLASAVQYALRSETPWTRAALALFLDPTDTCADAARAASITAARVLAHIGDAEPAWLETLSRLGDQSTLEVELESCEAALRSELLGLMVHCETSPDEALDRLPDGAATYLRSYVAMRALEGELGGDSTADENAPTGPGQKAWRDDHRQILLDVLSHLPRNWRAAVLRALATDADLGIRWATLHLTLNGGLVPGLFSQTSPAAYARIAYFRQEIATAVRAAGPHYWLEREILDAFLAVHEDAEPEQPRVEGMCFPSIAALDFRPLLFDESVARHPELQGRLERLRARVARVLLILPPITWPLDSGGDAVVEEGSPSLGLGQIAAMLAALGHYVEVLDAHRYQRSLVDVVQHAAHFDVVGLSTVFSTVESACALAALLARQSTPKKTRPCVVFGGHAATLSPGKLLASKVPFDFLVEGPGEGGLAAIVQAWRTGASPVAAGVLSTADLATQLRGAGGRRARAAQAYQSQWDEFPLVDRQVFRSPNGKTYEPALTRNGTSHEAHFTMSKGCDWKCTFCTEAILAGPREVRRGAERVLEEVAWVCGPDGARHAQFIDDNVFPPLAAPGLAAGEIRARRAWTGHFLAGLKRQREQHAGERDAFTWRGLLRLEDLIAYAGGDPRFLEDVAESGCVLLAFGVEHGNEDLRRKLKGGKGGATNAEIARWVERLRAVGVASKAYFIIGGPDDTEALAEQTLDLALSSGVDLAYFAIYKDFRSLSTESPSASQGDRRFRRFQFDLRNLPDPGDTTRWSAMFGEGLRQPPESYRDALQALDGLGFKFSNLFKYSDYHDDTDLARLYFDGQEQKEVYFRFLRRAYLEFYARRTWVESYRDLVSKGY